MPSSVSAARAAMLAGVTRVGVEQVALDGALGRILAEPVTAARDQPPFPASAMDGYAVRSADSPGTLAVIGESAAGRGFSAACREGAAVRISTGAAVPEGADAIVIQEDAQRDAGRVTVPAIPPRTFIRPQGGDFAGGAVLLAAGRKLDGVALALAAAAGAARLAVARPPRIAILCSGDELAAPGAVPGTYQVYDSATYGVAGLVRSWGGIPHRLTIERDDLGAIAQAAEQGLRDSDLLVVIGGASVGDHDHARPALLRLGLEMVVEKIAVRPGKPTWFGTTPSGPVLGLPGNPASALVCSCLFLRPLIAAMLGCDPPVAFLRARLERSLPANGPREHYLRARLTVNADGQLLARAFEDQDSSLLSVFAAANALIRLASSAVRLDAGVLVDVLMLDGFDAVGG